MTPPLPPPPAPSPLCPLPLSRKPDCERGSTLAAAGHSGRSGAIPRPPQAGVTRTCQGKKRRHHCGGILRVAVDNARALAWYFISFFSLFLPPTRTRRRRDLCDGAVLCRESLSLLPFPPTARRCRNLPSGGTPPCVVPFLGEEEGKTEEKKKMGAFLLPHPWADDDDDDASPPHPSLPLTFFLLLSRSVRTHRESLYTGSGFPSSPFLFCFCCCLYLLPSLYLTCWSVVTVCFSCLCA